MFAFLVSASLRTRVLVLIVAVIVTVYGVITQRYLSVDVMPDVNKGIITIITEAPGLAAEEVEVLVTRPIESAVAGSAGLTRLRSNSAPSFSSVIAEFDWGQDIHRARQAIVERLAMVQEQLPSDHRPMVMPPSSLMGEILLVAMSSETADPMRVRELADWVVAPRLQAVPGVSRVVAIGGQVRQYRVTPDFLRLNHLGITLLEVEQAITRFGSNSGGGVTNQHSQEYLIRMLGRTASLDDLRNVSVAQRAGQPVLLHQVAEVSFEAKQRRGDAGFMARPAVILSIQKQPHADTLKLTQRVEEALRNLEASLPKDVSVRNIVFRQADFIEVSIGNVQTVLLEAMVAVAIVIFLFLANIRTTVISLVAIPLSVLITFIVFRWIGLSLNTMTLGGLAIAIGELVDDAVVDVENIYRRLGENRRSPRPRPTLAVIADASQEIRSGIVQSTLIIMLVFVPVFAVPGIEGLFFAPLGIAYIVSIFASLIVSVTLTPVLCSYLLPRMRMAERHDAWLVRRLKRINAWLLDRVLDRPGPLLVGIGLASFLALAVIPTLPRAFMPPFNEGSLVIEMRLAPGISLEESARMATVVERVVMGVPEVRSVGRRTGRSEYDELALGVDVTDLEIRVDRSERPMTVIMNDVRQRIANLPGSYSVGQPINHRLFDHMLSGTTGQIVIKVFGDDLDVLRNVAGTVEQRLATVPGVVDLSVEKLAPVPQLQVTVDPEKAMLYGVQSGTLTRDLARLAEGIHVSDIVVGQRTFEVSLRMNDRQRDPRTLAAMLVATPSGLVPLSSFATVSEGSGPNEVRRENGRRRIQVTANGDGSDRKMIANGVREALAGVALPTGYFVSFEGSYAEQSRSSLRLLGLSLVSLALVFAMLYSRYRSAILAFIVMSNVPLALIGCVLALKITGLELSIASMVGFITLTGISTRNGILKINHFINLVAHEGERFDRSMVVRGAQERLVPVLTTAVAACVGLMPLLLDPSAAGREIIHPVAVVIFGGLISATILDAMLTPYLFLRFAREPLEALIWDRSGRRTAEVY